MAPLKSEFEKFYQAHFDKVYRFVFFRVGSERETAEDLVSEIFTKVLEHFASYDATRSQSAWVMTIARNHLKNYWRDKKPTVPLPGETMVTDEAPVESDADWLPGALKAWQQDETKRQIAELIAGLDTPAERQIVTFHYLFGYSYAEIGVMLGISEGAAKVAAHRAIKKLRRIL